MAVTLYRQVGKGKNRRYNKVNLGPGRRPAGLTGPYFLRYSHRDGSRPWEPVGCDLESAIEAQKQRQEYLRALRANVPVRTGAGTCQQQQPCEIRLESESSSAPGRGAILFWGESAKLSPDQMALRVRNSHQRHDNPTEYGAQFLVVLANPMRPLFA